MPPPPGPARRPRRAPAVATAAAALSGALASACATSGVVIASQPSVGDVRTYLVSVEATTSTEIEGSGRREVADRLELRAEQRVLEVSRSGASVVRVRLTEAGRSDAEPRTYDVRFDGTGRLAAVERVEGIPVEALGELGLPELVPGGAAAPPRTQLGPGERWRTTSDVRVGDDEVKVASEGRLDELHRSGDRSLALVSARSTVPVRRATVVDGTEVVLDGTQVTTATTSYRLSDGSVESSDAVTRAAFRLALRPPAGEPGPPAEGRLTVEVRSTTTRLR